MSPSRQDEHITAQRGRTRWNDCGTRWSHSSFDSCPATRRRAPHAATTKCPNHRRWHRPPNGLRFFTPHEAQTVEALASLILPTTDEGPGAREVGVLNA